MARSLHCMSQSSIRPGDDSDQVVARGITTADAKSQSSIRPGDDSDKVKELNALLESDDVAIQYSPWR